MWSQPHPAIYAVDNPIPGLLGSQVYKDISNAKIQKAKTKLKSTWCKKLGEAQKQIKSRYIAHMRTRATGRHIFARKGNAGLHYL